jgi:hypothetical protein
MFYSKGFELITNTASYTSAFGFEVFYLFVIAPLVPITSAYALKTKKNTLAKVLNVLQITLVVLDAIYVFTEPKTMLKKIMRAELLLYFFIYVIPSILNIRALAKNGK